MARPFAVKEYQLVIDETPSALHNFKKQAVGRIDCFICNEIAAKEVLKNPELLGIYRYAAKPVKEGPLYLGLCSRLAKKTL